MNWMKRVTVLVVAMAAIGCGGNTGSLRAEAQKGRGLLVEQLADGSKYGIYVPPTYDGSRPMRAIVFLHGLGEGGNDGRKNTGVGLGPAIARHPERFDDVIVLFPQSGNGSWKSDERHREVIAVLDEASKRYRIDPDRVVLTGLSTGGLGTWLVGAKYTDRFAALVPMCGYDATDVTAKLTRIPVWAFHNNGDPFVLAGDSKRMVHRINEAGGNAKVTVYGALGHNCWDRAYNDPELIAWMRNAKR